MTGPEHYKAAEECLKEADHWGSRAEDGYEVGRKNQAALLAEAQVHATLALAAASVLAQVAKGEESPWRLCMKWAEVTS